MHVSPAKGTWHLELGSRDTGALPLRRRKGAHADLTVFRLLRRLPDRAARAMTSPALLRYSGVSSGATLSRNGNKVAATPLSVPDGPLPLVFFGMGSSLRLSVPQLANERWLMRFRAAQHAA